jgi:hypothetical protein
VLIGLVLAIGFCLPAAASALEQDAGGDMGTTEKPQPAGEELTVAQGENEALKLAQIPHPGRAARTL